MELCWDDFRRFLDVYQCSDSLCSKCLLLRFGGGGGRYRCVAATLLNMIWVWFVCHFVHAVWYLGWILDAFAFISAWHFNMVAASHCSYFSQCVGRGQGSAAGAAEDHMTCMLDALKCMGLYT